MMSLLIVDDEPYTADGLRGMLAEREELGLELYVAYSAEEALQRLRRMRVDIVLSDIRMPGMSGLELHEWLRSRWPRCKVIFLTGYGDIANVQQALRGGSVDYILKTEGDEAIVKAVRGAIVKLEEELRGERIMIQAKEQMRQELALLRREWFARMAEASGPLTARDRTRFAELELPLTPDGPVQLVLGRVDRWDPDAGPSDRRLMINAIQNIACEYFSPVSLLALPVGDSRFVWLIQPGTGAWPETLIFVNGMLDRVQRTIGQLLKLPVSLVTTGTACDWERLPDDYRTVKQMMLMGYGDEQEMLMTGCGDKPPAATEGRSDGLSPAQAAELELALDSGLADDFAARLDEIFAALPARYALFAQAYYGAAVLLLGQIDRLGDEGAGFDDVAERLTELGRHASRDEAVQCLKDTARLLAARRTALLGERTHRVIRMLNQHIAEHLDSDLSLEALAGVVYLNPSYLSTLYKQSTGHNLSDYIAEMRMDKARTLLAQPQLRIHEIAPRVGFGAPAYFTRFFKKHAGLTPQEYRGQLPQE
ncbi:response regulator [Cohnella ginsengisoli]|uniref:Response regulator n=1 Tax=Cohnella ginsengisoli TaxID=425004 RepID=A0A9X4KFU7_9BACL|nr:response regulator [Cohnella ginsengisoli]MDG0791348.1 response regulator [Cohnella ginsengisoli]